ncbi:MAG: hypothetical protein ACHQ49_05560 [Elusimicrobiota bacterium]
MNPEIRVNHQVEMSFFKGAQVRYNSLLDDCGEIKKSLALLKKDLERKGKRLPPEKWERLHGALMSGEITRGKKSTPGDWAAREAKLLRAR